MELSIILTINAATLLTIAAGYTKLITTISTLTAITNQHEKRLDKLENIKGGVQ